MFNSQETNPAPPPLQVIQYDSSGVQVLSIDTLPQLESMIGKNCVTWLNVVNDADNAPLIKAVCETFAVHGLYAQSIIDKTARPTIEELDSHLWLHLKEMVFDPLSGQFSEQHLDILLGKYYVLSFSEDKQSSTLTGLRNGLLNRKNKLLQKNSDYFAYKVLDQLADHYQQGIERLAEQQEACEEQIAPRAKSNLLETIQQLRKQLFHLKKIIYPTRDIVMNVLGEGFEFIEDINHKYFAKVQDRLVHLADQLDLQIELNLSLRDLYFANLTLHTNNIMQTLTIIGSIFIPLTFFAGIYGMNFDVLPELHWRYGYGFFWVICVLIVSGLLVYFRRRKWL